RDGVFHRFCSQAGERSDEPHVLIIDEINRGNLSRILGELMMLIERDKRGVDYAIPLTYSSDEKFYVPENLFIMGLMNTADRSLAMVDYALRRRFGFIDLEPAFRKDAFRDFLLNEGVPSEIVKRIKERMGALNDAIGEDRKNLGPGYEIGHSYFVPSGEEENLDETWYQAVVDTEIAPLLREYWFDQPARLDKHLRQLIE
ncbi:MAG: AAA family ATPase, partial [Rhodothermales bacterium]